MNKTRELYKQLRLKGIPGEDARFILPNAVTSEIVISANLRQWRHIFGLRGEKHAQWEIRETVIEIFKILKEKCPSVFYDFEISEDTKEIINVSG